MLHNCPDPSRKAVRIILQPSFLILCLILAAVQAQAANKYALLVGIAGYAGPNALDGPVNDVNKMRQLLIGRLGFPADNITVLRDGQATRQAILNALDDLRRTARAGDVALFYYAGHGTVWPDLFSVRQDEATPLSVPANSLLPGILHPGASRKRQVFLGFKNKNQPEISSPTLWDSALCPFDHAGDDSGKPWGNLILDDELNDKFAGFKDIYFTFIADACNSGSSARGFSKTRSIPYKEAVGRRAVNNPPPAPLGQGPALGPRFAALTAARDEQLAYEIEDDDKQSCGLFSKWLRKELAASGGNGSYQDLLNAVRKGVGKGQEPQLMVFQEDTRHSPFLWPGRASR